MKKSLTGISQTQAWIGSNPNKVSFRTAAVIVDNTNKEPKYLLAMNKQIENMSAFINTTLSDTRDQEQSSDIIETLLRTKITERTGITTLTNKGSVQTEIHRKFRKPTSQGGHNEDAIYAPGSIMVFETQEQGTETKNYKLQRYTAQELSEVLKTDGSNGSSYLIREAYQKEHLVK